MGAVKSQLDEKSADEQLDEANEEMRSLVMTGAPQDMIDEQRYVIAELEEQVANEE